MKCFISIIMNTSFNTINLTNIYLENENYCMCGTCDLVNNLMKRFAL